MANAQKMHFRLLLVLTVMSVAYQAANDVNQQLLKMFTSMLLMSMAYLHECSESDAEQQRQPVSSESDRSLDRITDYALFTDWFGILWI